MEDMTATQLQEAFGISPADWRRLSEAPGLPEPRDPRDAQEIERWEPAGFARWLAAFHPDLAGRAPLLLRPAGRVDSCYLGGTYGEEPDEHFVGFWATGYGSLAIVYPRDRLLTCELMLDRIASAATVVVVSGAGDLLTAPRLLAVDRESPSFVYEPKWSDVSAHIGSAVPWWPQGLLRKEHLVNWSPQDQPVAVAVVGWPDWELFYSVALSEERGSAMRIACRSIGHQIRAEATQRAASEIADMNRAPENSAYTAEKLSERACMTIPAFPDPTDPGKTEAVEDVETIRDSVAELCRRSDELAIECLRQIMQLNAGRYTPFGASIEVIELCRFRP